MVAREAKPAKTAREAKLAKAASARGWTLQSSKAGLRLVDAQTGTLVAAVWTVDDGYGLTLDQIDAALAAI